ncbi:MAG: hypothetical protein RLZZ227_841 [Pseudomonadota bacterium]
MPSFMNRRTLAAAAFILSTLHFAVSTPVFAQAEVVRAGTLEQIRVPGPALEGNLEEDPSERDVFVYLPPGYADGTKRYPVVYFLHGYGVGAPIYVNGVLHLPEAADTALARGVQDTIVVLPDAFTRYGGSMYSNSPTIGDWESFIAKDLVGYIDTNYRTLATRDSRGLSGHSMGGYGTLRIGMKHPEVFGALYAMSSCCLMNTAPAQEVVAAQTTRMAAGIEYYLSGSFDNVMQAQAAAWAPNPQNAPWYFDLPFANGVEQPLVQAKWTANSQLVMVDQHVPALRQYKAIMLDVGDKDGLAATNADLDAALTRLGIAHGYEVYDGDHGNRVGTRFIEELLPFFAEHLVAE